MWNWISSEIPLMFFPKTACKFTWGTKARSFPPEKLIGSQISAWKLTRGQLGRFSKHRQSFLANASAHKLEKVFNKKNANANELDDRTWSPGVVFHVFPSGLGRVVFSHFVALVSHCNVRIDSHTRPRTAPPLALVDFGPVAAHQEASRGGLLFSRSDIIWNNS